MTMSFMIASSPIAAVMSNPRLPDNPIVECNDAFVALTGYQSEEIIGHNCRFLSGAGTEPWLTEMLRNGIRRRQPVMVEILNYKKDGTPFRNAVMVAPIFDGEGELEYFLGSQVEIAEDVARANDARREAAHDRVAALSRRRREVLLQMAAGKLNKQIAFELGLSERTVKMHRAAVFEALGVKTSADAIRLAIEAGY
ncbi:PAS domain-containing protein [Novosphingobium lentum]|uniref:PAS domain-containing protein n=1 Tax=Novosphingobium lentum TaxID=145287 RepID=UPI000829C10C|nr:PAS domain-containing protein [Novosphingobium lentum]